MPSFTFSGAYVQPAEPWPSLHCAPAPGRRHKPPAGAAFVARQPRADMIALPDYPMRLVAARSIGGTMFRWLAMIGVSVGIAGLSAQSPARAQAEPPADRAAAADRAKRDADKVYELIRMHADRPRKSSAVAAAAVPPSPPPLPSVASGGQPPSGPMVAKLTARPELPVASTTPRNVAAAVVELSATAPVASPAAPMLATELTVNQLPAAAVADRVTTAAENESPRTALVLVSSVDPVFPGHLVRRLGQGSVVVNFEVRPDGSVGATSIQKSRHAGLNEAALAAVAAWRFKPVSTTTAGVTELRFE